MTSSECLNKSRSDKPTQTQTNKNEDDSAKHVKDTLTLMLAAMPDDKHSYHGRSS